MNAFILKCFHNSIGPLMNLRNKQILFFIFKTISSLTITFSGNCTLKFEKCTNTQ